MRNTYSRKKSSAFKSFIAMLLCIAMLLGTTMAWFTDSVVSTGNRVQAGELGVQLLKHDGTEYKDITDGNGDIFSEADGTGVNWEPGRTEVAFLAVKNTKDLALYYTLVMDAINSTEPLTSALEYAIIPAMEKTVFEALNLNTWEDILGVDGVIADDMVKGQFFAAPESGLLKGETDHFVLAVHMKEDADDTYQGKATTINVTVAARQMAAEEDAFGNSNYDAEAPYAGEVWGNIVPEGILNFDNGLAPMTVKAATAEVVDDNGDNILKLVSTDGNTGRAQYSNNNSVGIHKGEEYKFTGWYKVEDDATVPSVTIWATGADSFAIPNYVKATAEGGWKYFEIPFTTNTERAKLIQFILNGHDRTNGNANAGIVYFDDLQVLRKMSEVDLMVEEWKAKLAAWEADSMMVQEQQEDPYLEKPALGPDLVTNGDFSADTNLPMVLVNQEVGEGILAHPTGWETKYNNTFKPIVQITADGTFRGEAPVGWTNTANYVRIVPQLHQTITDIIPGAQYQVKFRYKIEPTEWPGASWYGPYAYISSYGPDLPGVGENTIDYKICRPDQSTQGLFTDGEWHWYTETIYISGQAETVGIDMCAWLYEGDWIEIDDIQFYLVDLDSEIELGYETKFFYDDMGKTTFTADLLEDMFPAIAQDTGATAKFEVFDGKNLIWNTEKLALSGEGYVASAEFDLAKMTKKGEPYVLKATLYSGDGNMICETSEQIFVYKRPVVLNANGEYIKATPNGGKLDFNLAYAVVQDHYDETQQIGCNVMSLSNATSAEQVLERLDYCLKYGYMGMLNMNWGLYNSSDIDAKRWVLIDVASDERVRNHPALLGYCLTDEPWSWGAEKVVAANLEEGYRLIREFDKENIIFSVNNMVQYHDDTVKYGDAMFADHYESPYNGTIYDKASTAVEAANGRMPAWVILSAYKNRDYYPTADQARNTIYQAFMAGVDGIGYYAITYSDSGDNGPIPIWNVSLPNDPQAGQKLWDGLKSFKEKEWDIAYDHFTEGVGTDFVEKVAIVDGYMYTSWIVDGDVYVVVLNTKGTQTTVNVELTDGTTTIGAYSATVINGSEQADFTGDGALNVTLEKYQAVLYKLTPDAVAG